MKKQLFFSILLIFNVSIMSISCKKGPIQYSFEGKIVSSFGNSPISNANIALSQKMINNGIASENFSTAGSTSTDGSGNYSLVIDREKVTEFKFIYTKENYFPIEYVVSSASITTDGSNTIDKTLDPQTWISFEIKNTFPSETDHFKLITQTFREDCEGCAVNTSMDFYGPLDTTITYVTTGGKYARFIYINVTESSSTFDSIYATPFETITYPIIY